MLSSPGPPQTVSAPSLASIVSEAAVPRITSFPLVPAHMGAPLHWMVGAAPKQLAAARPSGDPPSSSTTAGGVPSQARVPTTNEARSHKLFALLIFHPLRQRFADPQPVRAVFLSARRPAVKPHQDSPPWEVGVRSRSPPSPSHRY